jgi:hypothetical protein
VEAIARPLAFALLTLPWQSRSWLSSRMHMMKSGATRVSRLASRIRAVSL